LIKILIGIGIGIWVGIEYTEEIRSLIGMFQQVIGDSELITPAK
jgi:hypothetical protein